MNTEQNKAQAQRIYDECFNQGNLAVISELFNPSYIDHNPTVPNQAAGSDGFTQVVSSFRHTFPDLHFAIEDMIAEGDKVMVRYNATGTDTGGFAGMPPTGRGGGLIPGFDILRFADGKVAERWGLVDMLNLLQQLEVIPAPGQ